MQGGEGQRHSQRQRQLWSIGDYSAMAPQYERAAADLVARAGIEPGMRVLDVCTGTGNVAIAAARLGAEVTGLDVTPEMFDDAEARATELGVRIDWDEGSADALPYPDATFDRVLSAFGMTFVRDGHAAARELVRVLRPGGLFALCDWAPAGAVLQVAKAVGGDGPPRPLRLPWGEPDRVRDFFDGLGVAFDFDRGNVSWLFPSGEDGVRWLEEVSGPIVAAKAALQAVGQWDASRARLVDWVSDQVRDDLDGVWITAEYLVTIGRLTGAKG